MPATEGTKRRKTDGIRPSTEGTTPTEYSKSITSLYLASLPKTIALIGNVVSTKHLKLLINIDKTKRRIDNLGTTSDKFPKSLEFNFKLSTTDTIKEDPRFKKLQQDSDENLTYCRKLLRDNCRKVAELELAQLRIEQKQTFAESVYLLATAFVMDHNSIPNTQKSYITLIVCAIRQELMSLQDTALDLLSQDTMEEEDLEPTVQSKIFQFSGFKFNLQNNRCHKEFYDHTVAFNHVDAANAPDPNALGPNDHTLIEPLLKEFTTTLNYLFYTGRTAYTHATKKREKDRTNLAWATSAADAATTQKTATVTATADLTSPELGDLIETLVTKKTTQLTSKISRLEQQIKGQSAARNTGGRNNRSNNKNNKKTANDNANRTGKKQKQGRKAADAANDTAAAKKKPQNRRRRQN